MSAVNITSCSRPLPADLKQTAQFIASNASSCGAIAWYAGGKLDPWDHTEAAMALSVAGHWRTAERAYFWLAENQLPDGSWYANYFTESPCTALRETNFVAYVATGVWHHYLVSQNRSFLADLFPHVERALEFVLAHQTAHGEIAWAVRGDGTAEDDALVTACASVLRSLDCGIRIAGELGVDRSHWLSASEKLLAALRNKPERFDRTWPSKARFSMDWYYPVLANVFDRAQARERLQARWSEFVVDGLGCRCVSDEPWVTMAETSELVLALIACGEDSSAAELYATLAQWRDRDGGYWTGYVFRDDALWPDEKTTWTAAAVILAADALCNYTRGAQIFSTQLKCRSQHA